ncbi:GIY-YIG nuclease family protein [Candidatus Dojkabacteria bacterium]|nr:GIY-YIG nuclease family protein [Candidatus Dojkabacteria bacterium]
MKPPYFVYTIRCRDDSTYIGLTSNFREELCRHRQGLIRKTKEKLPIRLVRLERYEKLHEAKFKVQILEAGYKQRLL